MDMTPKAELIAKIETFGELMSLMGYQQASWEQTGEPNIKTEILQSGHDAEKLRKEITLTIEAMGL